MSNARVESVTIVIDGEIQSEVCAELKDGSNSLVLKNPGKKDCVVIPLRLWPALESMICQMVREARDAKE